MRAISPEQADLIERLRTLLSGEPAVREVSMFGGRAFMVNDRMVVSAQKHGGLLVHADAERYGELLGRSGARPATMGTGRTMGPGWIEVSAGWAADDEMLGWWIGVAMEHNRAIGGPERGGAETL
ncbi:TfoX/Sxy family protein [Arthrobacter sp.]|uniref:TfoX/Sxy family protein n=1 Tax=Arthrobacter sp. TaxID=1667 RepID=UPI003A92EEF0